MRRIKMLEFNKVSITLKKDDRPIIKDFTFTLQPKEKMPKIAKKEMVKAP